MKSIFAPFSLLFFVLNLVLVLNLQAEPEKESKSIRVLCYNIHHGAGMDGKLDLERIAAVIKSVSPDVVSLQEVDQKTTRTNGVDQAKELARRTGMEVAFGSSMDFGGGQYGNAVLTKFKIEKSEVIPLPGEPRSALCVTLNAPEKGISGNRFLFVATHLDTSKEPRFESVPLIEKRFAGEKLPTILAGDFNATPDSPTMKAFLKTWSNATNGDAQFTVPVKDPDKQIDYILFRNAPKWKCTESEVLDEAVASDHRAIFAIFETS